MPESTQLPSSPSEKNRLPVRHPDFQYLLSENPYAIKLRELGPGRAYADNDTEKFRGSWRQQFQSTTSSKSATRRPLHVEIGCNAGHVIVEWAARCAERAYIGIDWKFKQTYRAAEKVQSRGIKNLIFFRAYAERINRMFAPGEIDHLYLFFPDPWPRTGQQKNRFVNPENLRNLASIVRPGGTFHIKTDHQGYFEWMEEALQQVQDLWQITERTTDLHANHPNPKKLESPEVTLFEKVFIGHGIKIKSIKLSRI